MIYWIIAYITGYIAAKIMITINFRKEGMYDWGDVIFSFGFALLSWFAFLIAFFSYISKVANNKSKPPKWL